MSKEFKKLSQQKRIESPIAKYNQLGQLTCIVCNQIVKSELMWNAHINSKSHLEAKNQLKMKLIGEQAKPISENNKNDTTTSKLKEKSTASQDNKMNSNNNTSTSGIKRANTESYSTTTTTTNNSERQQNNKKQKIEQLIKKTDSIDLNNHATATSTVVAPSSSSSASSNETVVTTGLPENFFDDPEMDAKVRGQSREANLEAEYEEFKKVIQTEEFKSDIIVEQDDKLRDFDRDIQEVDVLIERWNKIESLHQRREAIKQQQQENFKLKKTNKMDVEEDDDDDDEEIDIKDVMNMALRSKNIF